MSTAVLPSTGGMLLWCGGAVVVVLWWCAFAWESVLVFWCMKLYCNGGVINMCVVHTPEILNSPQHRLFPAWSGGKGSKLTYKYKVKGCALWGADCV